MATKKAEPPGADLRVIEHPEDRLDEAADLLIRSSRDTWMRRRNRRV
jgi:hypothetical protein